jgi:Na+-translocating ferredoxin:NAD+ oxidoreductase RnfG subunit
MNFNLKTKVFKSLVIYLTLLLIYSCGSNELKQNKDGEKSSKNEKELVLIETPSVKTELKIETENQEEHKAEREIEKTKEVLNKKKEISKPIPFHTSSSPSGGSASCYGGEIRFYEKDSNSIKRFYIATPNTRNIKNEEFCKISFKVIADANGNVISARVTSSGTTTTNQELINQVRDVVKSQLKYNKVDPNTPLFRDIISINIQPN